MEGLLLDATIFLAAAVIAVPLATRLGMGSVLGYLIAGIVIGPVLGLVGSEVEELRHFAEFGVVMLLFIVGLELEPRTLWEMRHQLFGLGGLQIILSTLLIAAGGLMIGHSWQISLAIGLVFALSSTAIVLQTLHEKGLMHTQGGRNCFSVLLTQDIAVIPILAFAPLLATPEVASQAFAADAASHGADHAPSLIAGLPGWAVTLITLGAIVGVILAGHYLSRPLFHYVARTRLREMFTAVALLIVIGIAVLMTQVGLSPALGAFLAGVVLAGSEFRHELESNIEPFKGMLLGLFFISVGAGIDFALLFENAFSIVVLTLAVTWIKLCVLFALAVLFRMRGRDRWLFTLGLAQAGEFGFVLVSFMAVQAVLPEWLADFLLISVAISMLITPLLFIAWDIIVKYLRDDTRPNSPDEIDEHGPIIVAGIGRFGQVVNRMIGASGYRTTVLDHDIKAIELMRRFGYKGFFGDPTRPEVLHAAGLAKAEVLVIALDDPAAAVKLAEYARRERPDLHIVARAKDRVNVYELFRAGANDIVRENFDSSLRAARYVMQHMGVPEEEAHDRVRAFFRLDRYMLQELARLWKPGVPVTDNEAYVRRSRDLNAELEAALAAQFLDNRRDDALLKEDLSDLIEAETEVEMRA
ncbi:MAG: cation:proton antiporter [Rhodobacteraceae bacterium]|jgi:CPA2 family monovalent cation:H+ antiporter-2|nr:cation:proton antiporter [Paracoccaceae bacterium]MBL4557020.1 cation:proton antiporter [Paracoccaceae bacterium]HBG98451.1 potassium transporter [Paracoccaceae bacterium]